MGIDTGGDSDVGVPEKFLDNDEIDALFQEQGVPDIVKADRPEPCAVRRRRKRWVRLAESSGLPFG